MTQKIYNFLKRYSTETVSVDKLIVSSYLYFNEIKVKNNTFILNYIIEENDEDFCLFKEILKEEINIFKIEDLIRLFEFVISPAEKEINGAVYTPSYIRDYIIDNVLNHFQDSPLDTLTFADISCGCGGFFYTLITKVKEKQNIKLYDFYRNNIIGVDIKEYSIIRTKILLILLAIQNGEDIQDFEFNLFVSNSLSFDFTSIEIIKKKAGVSAVIGNPPYVGSSKIDNESKALLYRWEVTQTGKTDLYIPFFQIGVELLHPNGILGYITVNNFYRSLNGRGIREYFSSNKFPLTIIDFGAEQVFKGRSTYTCLCFIIKSDNGHIDYIKSKSKSLNKIRALLPLAYENLDNHEGWILQKSDVSNNVLLIENAGTPLGKLFEIKNGFATLRNKIYIFSPINETENLYQFKKGEDLYWIEKDVCRDAIKPNVLKHEDKIEEQIEKIIFPYTETKASTLFSNYIKVDLIDESKFTRLYPLAYKYLQRNKAVLAQRDKGTREYPIWYAFGRSQALAIRGYKLLFPYIADQPYFVLSNQKDLLFYNGYALISDNWRDLQIIQKVLKSKIFWYYIKATSKPYGGDYYALAKNYIKNFSVPDFTENQKNFLLQNENQKVIDDFLLSLYKLQI